MTTTALSTSTVGLAADHLRRIGLEPIAREFETRHGTISIVARDLSTQTLVFVDVASAPTIATREKRAQVRHMARCYLAASPHEPRARRIRFDLVVVRRKGLDHVEDAY
jgi:Holliday junction resolvase-like predicted endonuclease